MIDEEVGRPQNIYPEFGCRPCVAWSRFNLSPDQAGNMHDGKVMEKLFKRQGQLPVLFLIKSSILKIDQICGGLEFLPVSYVSLQCCISSLSELNYFSLLIRFILTTLKADLAAQRRIKLIMQVSKRASPSEGLMEFILRLPPLKRNEMENCSHRTLDRR